MDIQWSMIWTQSNAAAATSRRQRDAFADPVEMSEWEGLGWSIPLVSRLVSGAPLGQKNRQKIKEVERFTKTPAPSAVCVS
jgi:hypothetical protein